MAQIAVLLGALILIFVPMFLIAFFRQNPGHCGAIPMLGFPAKLLRSGEGEGLRMFKKKEMAGGAEWFTDAGNPAELISLNRFISEDSLCDG